MKVSVVQGREHFEQRKEFMRKFSDGKNDVSMIMDDGTDSRRYRMKG